MTISSQVALQIWLAGTAGTTAMTAAVLAVAATSRHELNVLKILGTMLTGGAKEDGSCSKAPSTFALGIATHYAVGYLFAVVYFWLWNNNIMSHDFVTTTLLGFLTGVFGIVVWRVYFAIHRRPPAVPLVIYLTCICLSHILFALGAMPFYA
jgi:hypothetical protein